MWGCPGNELADNVNVQYDSSYSTTAKTQINVVFKWNASVGCNGWGFRGRDNSNNLVIKKTTLFKDPSKLVYCADGRTGTEYSLTHGGVSPDNNTLLDMHPNDPVAPYEGIPGWFSFYIRHKKIINNGFLDGHVEGIDYTEFLSWCRVIATYHIRFIGDTN